MKQGGLFSRLILSKNLSDKIPADSTSHLIWTNDPPSEIERTELELAISRAENQRDELKAALDGRNPLEVARVKRSLKELDAFIHTRKPILSPLRYLPDDILSYIFAICFDPIRTRPWVRTHWYDIPSFTLSQVCRQWRIVALETPILWSILGDVRLDQKSGSNFGYSYTKFLETLLRRSKTLDLWIYIYAPFQELDTHRAIASLVRHAKRWRVVTFETTISAVAVFRGVQHRLPRLQTLSLGLWHGEEEGPTLTLFSDAPLLTEVTILSNHDPRLELPWGQLRALSEQTKTECSQVAHFFNNSPDLLEHLEINLRPNTRSARPSPISPVTFPKLKTLRLTFPADPDYILGSFISVFCLPCLEELYLTSYPTSILDHRALLQCFTRSSAHSTSPSLKRLSLFNLGSPSILVEFLRLVPHLEHLEVDVEVVQHILPHISVTNEQTVPLLPELKTLVINWDQFEDIDDIDDIVDGFEALTSLTCKRTISSDGEASNHAHTLTDISLVFSTQASAFFVQRHLNNWCGWADQRIILYDHWRTDLHLYLTRPRRNCGAEVHAVLNNIEKLVPQEVNYIYASKLYGSLVKLGQLNNKRLVQDDEKYHLRMRAKAIIENWDAIIRADIADDSSRWRKNWVARGETTLQYVPDDYVFRDLCEAVQLICGFIKESDIYM